MGSVADASFLGGGSVGSCDDAGDGCRPCTPAKPGTSSASSQALTRRPNTSAPHLAAVNMAADLKYYELYRRSRYCARPWESDMEHAG